MVVGTAIAKFELGERGWEAIYRFVELCAEEELSDGRWELVDRVVEHAATFEIDKR